MYRNKILLLQAKMQNSIFIPFTNIAFFCMAVSLIGYAVLRYETH